MLKNGSTENKNTDAKSQQSTLRLKLGEKQNLLPQIRAAGVGFFYPETARADEGRV